MGDFYAPLGLFALGVALVLILVGLRVTREPQEIDEQSLRDWANREPITIPLPILSEVYVYCLDETQESNLASWRAAHEQASEDIAYARGEVEQA